jgi:hypothetical protein
MVVVFFLPSLNPLPLKHHPPIRTHSQAANDPAMREKAKELLAQAKEKISDPEIQKKLKDAATKLAEYAK